MQSEMRVTIVNEIRVIINEIKVTSGRVTKY